MRPLFVLNLTLLLLISSSVSSSFTHAESTFERWTREQGGLPANWEELLRASRNSTGVNESAIVLTPDSRSLQRPHATLLEPRRISQLPDGSFVGFTADSHSMEVISWNATEGRSEFFVIHDFGIPGRSPRIERLPANENACLTCHQHGGPIFSREPWTEMDGVVAPHQQGSRQNLLPLATQIDTLRRSRGLPSLARIRNVSNPANGISIRNATFFDAQVRGFNSDMQLNQVCKTACGNDLQCRRLLLQHGILGALRSNHGSDYLQQYPDLSRYIDSLHSRITQLMQPHWPSNGYAYISAVLPDRNPTQSPAAGGTTEVIEVTDPQALAIALRNRNIPGDPLLNLSSENLRNLSYLLPREDLNSRLQGLPGWRISRHTGIEGDSPGNPSRPRPQVEALSTFPFLDGEAISRACFGLNRRDIARLEAPLPEILSKLQNDSTTIQAILESWPTTGDRILAALIENQNEVSPTGLSNSCSLLPPPLIDPALIAALPALSSAIQDRLAPPEELSPIRSFERTCARCHGGATSVAAPLPLNSLNDLARYKNGAILDRLTRAGAGRMPPSFVSTANQPSSEERERMIRALRSPPQTSLPLQR